MFASKSKLRREIKTAALPKRKTRKSVQTRSRMKSFSLTRRTSRLTGTGRSWKRRRIARSSPR